MLISSHPYSARTQAYRIVFVQLLCVLALSLFAILITDTQNSLSLLCGGMAYALPTFLFVWLVFRFTGAQQMTQFVVAFFLGEMFKLVLSAILFIIIVKYLPVSLLSVLIGFIGAIISFWFACIWLFSKQTATKTS